MITTLSQASALNPGAELWVMADLEHCQWTAKIDWYLNFQIVKASRHEAPILSEFLAQIIDNTGVQVPEILALKDSSLLIHSQSLLPNKWVAVIPYVDNLKEWLKQISELWQGLQNPSLRIFLPTGQISNSVTKSLLSTKEEKEITVVLDLSS